ncbi:MAG: hypothetical protein HN802_05325 [Candidatus Jacksonbacteria bacterium]|nr:hypothetical protein [Candidatus Jacksonbacteria bacterium]
MHQDISDLLALDTMRLLLTEDSNLDQSWCVKPGSQEIIHKIGLADLPWKEFNKICIDGGEPFIYWEAMWDLLETMPADKDIWIYTNGLLIEPFMLEMLNSIPEVKGLNIQVYFPEQIRGITPLVDKYMDVRWDIKQIDYKHYLQKYHQRLGTLLPGSKNFKIWAAGDDERENELVVSIEDYVFAQGLCF